MAASEGRTSHVPVLEISGDRDVDFIAPWMEMVVDPQGTLGVAEIKAEFSEGNPRGITTKALNFGLSSSVYYLRIQSTTGLMLRPRLFTADAYFEHGRMITFWYGGFYGILLSVAAYSLFLIFSFNDRSYQWYVLHLVFAILYFLCVNGLADLKNREESLEKVMNRADKALLLAKENGRNLIVTG